MADVENVMDFVVGRDVRVMEVVQTLDTYVYRDKLQFAKRILSAGASTRNNPSPTH